MSTEINLGINTNSRPSSRVLKPPGGGHSNIFSEPDAPEIRPRPKYNQQNSSSLNACMNTVDPNEKVATMTKAEMKAAATEVFVEKAAFQNGSSKGIENVAKSNDSVSKNIGNQSGPTTIRNSEPVNQKGRVPPGGFSSGLW